MTNQRATSKRRAQLRRQQELEEDRRRFFRVLVAGVVALGLLALTIVILVLLQRGTDGADMGTQVDPPHGTEANGIMITSKDVEPTRGVPHVIVYEDLQCSGCAALDAVFGPVFSTLVDDGTITLEVRYATFRDDALGNHSSTDAASAAAAADTVGKFREFHSHVLSQLAHSPGGYTEQQLRNEFPKAVGIEGQDLAKFQEFYDSQTFMRFVEASNATFQATGIRTTPTVLVGDVPLRFFDETGQEALVQATPEDLLRAITEAAG